MLEDSVDRSNEHSQPEFVSQECSMNLSVRYRLRELCCKKPYDIPPLHGIKRPESKYHPAGQKQRNNKNYQKKK